jgi:hypothetical protein
VEVKRKSEVMTLKRFVVFRAHLRDFGSAHFKDKDRKNEATRKGKNQQEEGCKIIKRHD